MDFVGSSPTHRTKELYGHDPNEKGMRFERIARQLVGGLSPSVVTRTLERSTE